MEDKKYVSRGGLKLEHALRSFELDVAGLTVLDIGSSTGGFVDCLLQSGAAKIYSLDTAYGELAWKLRKDPRVVVIERQNILYFENLPEPVDLITIDVTFTSLKKILSKVKVFLKDEGKIIALVKPQYEDQKTALKNHGVVPTGERERILDQVIKFAENNNFKLVRKTESPILGGKGNTEFLIYLTI